MPSQSGPFIIDGVSYETDANGTIFRTVEKKSIAVGVAQNALGKKQAELTKINQAINHWISKRTLVENNIDDIQTLIAATQ